MDLIDREQLMNYIRSRKINIGKLAHDVIMKQPSIQPQEPCEDAISRKEVLNQIFYSTDNGGDVALGSVLRHRIENLKSVKPQEPKTGYWVAQDIHNCHTDFKCSECDYIHSFMHLYGKPTADYTYCPNCGAKMESEVEE